MKNFTKNSLLELDTTSHVYKSKDGVFLNTTAHNATLSIYNSLYPYMGQSHVLHAKVSGDLKIGTSEKNLFHLKVEFTILAQLLLHILENSKF